MELLINPSKEVLSTVEEFLGFSYYEVATFFVNYKACVRELEDGNLKIYTSKYQLVHFSNSNYRFKNMPWYENSAAEIYYCIVNDENLKQSIKKYFKHKFLK